MLSPSFFSVSLVSLLRPIFPFLSCVLELISNNYFLYLFVCFPDMFVAVRIFAFSYSLSNVVFLFLFAFPVCMLYFPPFKKIRRRIDFSFFFL